MNDFNLEFNENYFKACDYGEVGGYKTLKSLLANDIPPTALFVADDYVAIGAMQAAEDNGLKVPQDISIIGSGDMLNGSNIKTALTTFDDRFDELGALCLEMLEAQLTNRPIKNSKISLEPKLIIRDSCTEIINNNQPINQFQKN
jgi:LacI family repressor for deo operon, udp, cdd, tsx, nupC, and nupG